MDMLATVLEGHPDVRHRLDAVHDAAWRFADPALLELCRLRVAMLLGDEVESDARTALAFAAGLEEATVADLARWPTSPLFGLRERACLAFCEQFVIDVAGMTDDIALELVTHLGPDQARTFVAALLVVEQRQRLRLAWGRLFDSEEVA